MLMNLATQVVSVVGAVLILGAFVALQRGRWRSHSPPYLWSNFVGATLLALVATWDRQVGFILLEGAWAALALLSLLGRSPPPAPNRRVGPL